jgi:uncharacterized membrane protein
MKLYGATADTLRYSMLVSMIFIMLGLVTDWMGHGEDVLWFGMLMLILTPLFGILVSFVCLVSEKDRHWTNVTAILLSVITAGIVIAVFV